MSAPTWVTVVAFDTPFLAQLATERLDDHGIRSRLLSDSGGETLPHISFATGGYRVQVPRDAADAARSALAELDGMDVDALDVGQFTDTDGVQPPQIEAAEDEAPSRQTSPLVVGVVVAVCVGLVLVGLGVLAGLA